MPEAGSVRYRHWMGGYNLSNGALTSIESYSEAPGADVTALNDTIMSEGPLGRVMYMITESGFLRERGRSLRRLLSDRGFGPWLSLVAPLGNQRGGLCEMATKMRIKNRSIPPELDSFTRIELDYYLDSGGELFDDKCFMIAGGEPTVAEVAAPYTSVQYDGGAPSTNGAAVGMMVTPETRFGGATQLTVTLYHSSNRSNASTWRALPGCQITVQWNQVPRELFVKTTGAVSRYLAVAHSFTGQSVFAIDNAGGYAAGATEIHVDGRGTEAEGLVVGDTISIGSTTYTVAGTTLTRDNTDTEFDITLDRGLDAAVSDDDAVTVTTAKQANFVTAVQRL